MKYTMTFIYLLIALVGNVWAGAESARGEADLAITTLTEIGLPSGYTFEGLQADHEKNFHVYIPRSALAGAPGELVIYYRASPELDPRSMLRVDINGSPKGSRSVSGVASEGRLSFAVSDKELRENPYINITVKASLLVSNDYCLDDRLATHFLQILPSSGLQLKLKNHATNLQDAWDILPKEVTVSLPEKLSEEAYGNALLVARYLIDSGKEINYVQLPQLGDVVVANAEEVAAAVKVQYLATEELRKKYGVESIAIPQQKNMFLLDLPDRQVITVAKPYEAAQGEFMSSSWRGLALGRQYQVLKASSKDLAQVKLDGERIAIPLTALNADLNTRSVLRSTDWYMPIPSTMLGGDLMPETLNLELVSSPSDTQVPMLLQIFLNGVLQQVETLPNDGQPHQMSIHLSQHDVRSSYNELHIVAMRTANDGSCRSLPPAYPVQITSNSYLVTSRKSGKPQEFRDLGAWFASGVDIYLPELAEQDASKSISFLAKLISHNGYPLEITRIKFYKPEEALKPAGPFIVVGPAALEVKNAGVRFDQGRVQVVNSKGELLLDVDQLPNLAISQLVESGDTYGLWLLQQGKKYIADGKALILESDSVAFFDQNGLIFSMDPDQRNISTVEYPDDQAWFDLLGRYSFWFWALAWILLTLAVVHLYNKSRQHRKV